MRSPSSYRSLYSSRRAARADAPRAVADEGEHLLVFCGHHAPASPSDKRATCEELFHTIVQRATSDTAILAYSRSQRTLAATNHSMKGLGSRSR